MTTWRGYNGSVEYSDASTDMMLSAPRQAVLLAGGAAFGSTDRMSTTLTTPCVETTWRLDRSGYGRRRVKGHNVRHHRLAWEQANGPIPDGMWVLHRCDNPPCINPDHLFLGGSFDNNHDRWAKGRYKTGRSIKNAKLTPDDVLAIREAAARGVSRGVLGEAYGVAHQTVSQIVSGRAWAHVPPGTPRSPYAGPKNVREARRVA